MTEWARPSARGGDEDEGPFEGVPPWLRKYIQDWLRGRYHDNWGDHYDESALERLERRLKRFPFDWHDGGRSALASVMALVYGSTEDQEIVLDAIHFTLQGLVEVSDNSRLHLEELLREGGSAWKVAVREDTAGLERRVSNEVARAAEHAIQTGGGPGGWLRTAWTAAYGRDPDPNEAYDAGIKAVEAAAQNIVEPKNTMATLGTMIKVMSSKPEQWEVAIRPREGKPNPVETVVQTMQLLWRGHYARHGSGDHEDAVQMEQAEAEAAVQLAVLLVQWFTSGAVGRT